MLSVLFDYTKCDKCGKCISICCNSKVLEKNEDGFPDYKNVHKCIQCGHCMAICPKNAITTVDTSKKSKTTYYTEPQSVSIINFDAIQIQQLLSSTRSNRFFIKKEIDKESLGMILDAMIRSPSAGNEQNRNFYIFPNRKDIINLEQDMQVIHKKQSKYFSNPIIKHAYISVMMKHAKDIYDELGRSFSKEEMKNVLEHDLSDINNLPDDFFYKASSAAIIVTSDTRKKGFHKDFYKADIAIAITHGTIFAAALGIASCRMGLSEIIFNKDNKLKLKYNIPSHERIDGIIAFGYSNLQWKQIPIRGTSKVIWN